jgi:hypothetical protein
MVNQFTCRSSGWVDAVFGDQCAGEDAAAWEVGHRVAARFVQQHHIVAVGDPISAEAHPHPTPQRLGEQQVLRHRVRAEQLSGRPGSQWALLPCQSHGGPSFLA